MFTVWIFIFLFFLIAEAGVPGLFFCLSIACGALAGLAGCFYGISFEKQMIFFCIATGISFYVLRLLVTNIQSRLVYKTGAERLKGSVAYMLTPCNQNNSGTVHIAGTTWNAQSLHQELIETGTSVRIIDIKNITLIVQPIKQHGGKNV